MSSAALARVEPALPVMAISAGVSVNELAARLIASLRTGERPPGETGQDASQQIMQRHGINDAFLAAGMDAVEAATKHGQEAVALA